MADAPASMRATHPLDPLRAQEIEQAATIVREALTLSSSVTFVAISPVEPPRGAPGPHPRAAEVILRDASDATVELVVDLDRGEVISHNMLAGVQAPMTIEEVEHVERSVRRDPRFVEALRRRGIDAPETVDIDPQAAGAYGTPEEQDGRRLARLLAYKRPSPGGNAYANPIEGVFGVVDVDTGELLHFEDRDPPVPLPPGNGEYRAEHVPLRSDVRPIQISQLEGPSFTVDGNEVRWQKWRFRVGFNSREGLVLHNIAYEDDGELRQILRRASYAEMVVPYADPDRFYQSPLDIGEFNVGTFTNSLTLGCDCLGVIHYFDGAFCDSQGRAVTIPNAVCLHEEDDGILWKHTDFRTGHVEVRRGRRLVISSIVTVGNYEYGFFWYLHQDGTIASEVKATGIVATQAVAENRPTRYGKLVAPYLNAVHHQHIFCVRLDFGLDGDGHTVREVQTEAVPQGPENPHGNAWVTVSRPLETELQARRRIDLDSARAWVVVNPNRLNAVEQPVGYRLIPGENAVPFAAPGSPSRRRAAFMDYHLWVTRYSPDERYPAGDYPYQHPGDAGLPAWVQADRSIVNTDLVVWYTMNHHHVPRPEDWPVMPVARFGFHLKPWGFFDRSPALDVPPTAPGDGSCHITAAGHATAPADSFHRG